MELLDIFKKTMLTGVGLALVAKDEVEEVAKELEKKMNMTEQDGKQFFKDLQKRYDEAQDKLEDRVEKAVRDFMKKADVVTGDELKALKKEIRELKKAVGKDRKKVARVLLLTDTSDIENLKNKLTDYSGMKVIQNTDENFLSKFSFKHKDSHEIQDITNGMFFIDPLGNYIMGYPSGADATKILSDLQRLLKVSRTGNMI